MGGRLEIKPGFFRLFDARQHHGVGIAVRDQLPGGRCRCGARERRRDEDHDGLLGKRHAKDVGRQATTAEQRVEALAHDHDAGRDRRGLDIGSASACEIALRHRLEKVPDPGQVARDAGVRLGQSVDGELADPQRCALWRRRRTLADGACNEVRQHGLEDVDDARRGREEKHRREVAGYDEPGEDPAERLGEQPRGENAEQDRCGHRLVEARPREDRQDHQRSQHYLLRRCL